MKYYFLYILFFAPIILCGQEIKFKENIALKWNNKIYLDEHEKEVKEKKATKYILINLTPNGLPAGVAKIFDIKGVLLWEGEFFIFNRDDFTKNKLQGYCVWYFKNNKISRESVFKNGMLDGKTVFYNEGGKIIYTGIYKNGKLENGKMTQIDDDGTSSKIYTQDFSGFYDSWDNEKNQDGQSEITNGILKLKSISSHGYFRKEYLPIESGNDFSIETSIEINNYSSTTIYYGFKDFQNYYGVTITSDGYLKLQHVFEGINIDRSAGFKVNINHLWNVIKLLKMGEDVYVSLNGNIVTSYKFTKLYGEYFGYFLPKKGQEIYIAYILTKEFSYRTSNNVTESQKKPEEKRTNTNREQTGDYSSEDNWLPNGTGFYIAKNGLIITNYHVIKNGSSVGITQFINGRKNILKVKVILTDAENDLALLQVEDVRFVSPGSLPYTLKPDVAEVGESIFTMGYPLTDIMGDEIKITDGIISARSGLFGNTRDYQISAPITFGNSGGPLLDKEGNILGMNSSGINRNLAENTGYSIKSTLIINFINSMNEPPILEANNILKGKQLKEQVKILRSFVPMICIRK